MPAGERRTPPNGAGDHREVDDGGTPPVSALRRATPSYVEEASNALSETARRSPERRASSLTLQEGCDVNRRRHWPALVARVSRWNALTVVACGIAVLRRRPHFGLESPATGDVVVPLPSGFSIPQRRAHQQCRAADVVRHLARWKAARVRRRGRSPVVPPSTRRDRTARSQQRPGVEPAFLA